MKMSDIRIPALLKEQKSSLHVLTSLYLAVKLSQAGVCCKVAKCLPLNSEKGSYVAKILRFNFLAS